MFEKVNPMHPDKIADRIAGALVDYAYTRTDEPRIAVEVLIGHGECHIIAETSVSIPPRFVRETVKRIAGRELHIDYAEVPQDPILADNQIRRIRCGDNGIFKGMPMTDEQYKLTRIAKDIYDRYESDGKYVLDGDRLIICQSGDIEHKLEADYPFATVNPLGYWTGGTDVDSGATNRKLGSDMGDSVTGGGLHGKDLSKADVSVNIYVWLQAQRRERYIAMACAIGDEKVLGVPYSAIVEAAREYIDRIGGFEKFAEWGLIRP